MSLAGGATRVRALFLVSMLVVGIPVWARPAVGASPKAIAPPPASQVIYPLPSPSARPTDLTVGPDGNLWAPYTSYPSPHQLARISTDGSVTEFPFTTNASARVATGADGNLWLLDVAGYPNPFVEKISSEGTLLATYVIPSGGGYGDIIAGPDGNIWLGLGAVGLIVRITPAGDQTLFHSPSGVSSGLAAGPDGNVWFGDPFGDKVGRIDANGTITAFDVPASKTFGWGPSAITAGPDGNLWYLRIGKIGRISPTGTVTEFVLPNGAQAGTITSGPDGNLWFTVPPSSYSSARDLIGRVTPAGSIGLFQSASLGNESTIVSGPDGRLWYTMEEAASVAAFSPFDPGSTGPDVQELAPRSGSSTGGTPVTITGNDVGSATQVLFGSKPATFTVLGPGRIQATAPPQRPGKVNVRVFTADGRSTLGDQSIFYYTSPACGRVITQSTTLTADIGPCYDDGVVIGADNITVDLGGKSIYNFVGPSDGEAVGVRLPHRTGVTLRNGRVAGFDAGVLVRSGGGNTLTGLTVQDNIGPDDIPIVELGDGIFIDDSPNNQIVGNVVDHNGFYDGIGIYGPEADGNVVRDNLVTNTAGPENRQPSGVGVIVNGANGAGAPTSIENTLIEHNTVRSSGSGGIASINSVNGRVVDNTVEKNGATNSIGNGIGVSVGFNWASGPTNMVVQGNRVHGNGVDGIRIGAPVGFSTGAPTGNRVIGNDASGNNANPKVDAYEFQQPGFDLHDFNPTCADNVWLGNTWGNPGYSPACTASGGSGPHVGLSPAASPATAGPPVVSVARTRGRRP